VKTHKTHLFLAYSLAAIFLCFSSVLSAKKTNSTRQLEFEGQMLLASYNDQKDLATLSHEEISKILTAADSVKAITEHSSTEDLRTLWPANGENAFTKILDDNDLTTLHDVKNKVLMPHHLNTHIKHWIARCNKSIFMAKSNNLKTIANSLKQAIVETSDEEEQACANLYSIFFRAYAVKTIDTLAKITQTPEITKALTGKEIEDLLKRFNAPTNPNKTNFIEKHSNIFAETLVHNLNITDPDTANNVLLPLYSSQPIEDLECIAAELTAVMGRHQKLFDKTELGAMEIPLNAYKLNAIIQRPATYMNKALANVSQEILEQLLRGISSMNDTINDVGQNVGPYKKASEALATTAEGTLKALTDAKQAVNDLLKKLTQDDKKTPPAKTKKRQSPEPRPSTSPAPNITPSATLQQPPTQGFSMQSASPLIPPPTIPFPASTAPTITPSPASASPFPQSTTPSTEPEKPTLTTTPNPSSPEPKAPEKPNTGTAATYAPGPLTPQPATPRPSGPFGGPMTTPSTPKPPTPEMPSATPPSTSAPVSTLNTGTPLTSSSIAPGVAN
jgi:hypothetical protein